MEKVLEENPTVQVLIDLHRDGVPEGKRLVTKIGGRDTAQIMFYNGLSYTVNQGKISYLPNPYTEENLAFSFQLEYTAAGRYYPGFYRCIYLAGLRYRCAFKTKGAAGGSRGADQHCTGGEKRHGAFGGYSESGFKRQ